MTHPLARIAAVDAPLGAFDPNTINPERAAADPDVAYEVIAERWKQLLGWLGDSPNVPELHGQIESWRDFEKKWKSSGFTVPRWPELYFYKFKDSDGLGGQAANLAGAESNAASHGYVVPRLLIDSNGKVLRADIGAPTGVNSPGPTSPHAAARASAMGLGTVVPPPATPSIDTLHPVATEIAKVTTPSPRQDDPDAIPAAAKFAVLATLAATSAATTAAMKSDAHRAAAAGGGILVTAVAAWAMFWPSSKTRTDARTEKKEKEKRT